jgi:hypothetical protein
LPAFNCNGCFDLRPHLCCTTPIVFLSSPSEYPSTLCSRPRRFPGTLPPPRPARALASIPSDPMASGNEATLRVLCFGDSLTSGYSAYGAIHHPYCEALEELLRAARPGTQLEVVEDGKDGDMVCSDSRANFLTRIRKHCGFLFVHEQPRRLGTPGTRLLMCSFLQSGRASQSMTGPSFWVARSRPLTPSLPWSSCIMR